MMYPKISLVLMKKLDILSYIIYVNFAMKYHILMKL